MARVTYVKKAQQRYETIPVLNEDGSPKQVPVTGRDGEQKVTKHGRPVFRSLTVDDKTKPLPLHDCGHCHLPIEVGTPYKHISPRSGPYGGRMLTRHEDCPSWNVWEYSSSLSARLAEVAHNYTQAAESAESAEDVTAALEDAAGSVREIAEEKRESASNIEDGFGHATSQSDELNEIADSLDGWADEIESAEVPDFPEPEEQDCEECTEGLIDDPLNDGETIECPDCDGTGRMTPDEPTEEQMDEWRSEIDAIEIVNESPV